MVEESEPRDVKTPAEYTTATERQREDEDLVFSPGSALPAHTEERVLVLLLMFVRQTLTLTEMVFKKKKEKKQLREEVP